MDLNALYAQVTGLHAIVNQFETRVDNLEAQRTLDTTQRSIQDTSTVVGRITWLFRGHRE